MATSLKDLLERASTRPTDEPEWAVDEAPAEPVALVAEWLQAAIDAEVLAAQTVTLATATSDGTPSARTVLISDVTDDGFWFATSAAAPAGRDLIENPSAELVFYLREQSRQIRVRGSVARGDAERSAEAFHARGAKSQAVTLAGTQSAPLPDDADARIEAASGRLDADGSIVDPDWTAFVLAPTEVEFWQSRHGSGEVRLQYRREPGGWTRERLWP